MGIVGNIIAQRVSEALTTTAARAVTAGGRGGRRGRGCHAGLATTTELTSIEPHCEDTRPGGTYGISSRVTQSQNFSGKIEK